MAVGPAGGGGAVLVLRVNAATGEPVASILLDAGGQLPRRGLMTLDRLAEGLLVEAGGAAPGRDLIPFRRLPGGALLPDAGAGVPRDGLLARNRFPELLLINAAPILDADVVPPRGYFVADDQVRAALRLVGAGAGAARRYVVANDRLLGALVFDAGSAPRRRADLLVLAGDPDLLAAPDGPRGLHSSSALFRGAVLAAPGSAAGVVAAAEAQVQRRVLVAAFGGDRLHSRDMVAVVELQLLGAASEHRINVLVAIERQGVLPANQRAAAHDEEFDFWNIAGAEDGHHDEPAARVDESDRIVVRVFDGVHGRLVAATYDQRFGRALLAALAPSRGADGDTVPLRVILEVEALGRGIAITGARSQLSASPSTRSNGEGPVISSLGLPHGPSSPEPSRPSSSPSQLDSELTDALNSLASELRKLDRKRDWKRLKNGKQRRTQNGGSAKMSKFRSLLDKLVFFALPLVLIFYPTMVQSQDISNTQRLGWVQTHSANNTSGPTPSTEEKVVVALFAIVASIWILGVVLATFGKGRQCVSTVALLTYISVLSVVAFIIFALSKTMPEDILYSSLFVTQFIVMIVVITYVWAKFVKMPRLPLPNLQELLESIRTKWQMHNHAHRSDTGHEENPSRVQLINGFDMV